MTRRLLALLAILSGLAALHAPAQASRVDRLAYDVQALAQATNAPHGAVCQRAHAPRAIPRKCPLQPTLILHPQAPGVLAPSLIIGVDRALE